MSITTSGPWTAEDHARNAEMIQRHDDEQLWKRFINWAAGEMDVAPKALTSLFDRRMDARVDAAIERMDDAIRTRVRQHFSEARGDREQGGGS